MTTRRALIVDEDRLVQIAVAGAPELTAEQIVRLRELFAPIVRAAAASPSTAQAPAKRAA